MIINYLNTTFCLNFARVAQWLEHHSYKVGVDGSSPSTRIVAKSRGLLAFILAHKQ